MINSFFLAHADWFTFDAVKLPRADIFHTETDLDISFPYNHPSLELTDNNMSLN